MVDMMRNIKLIIEFDGTFYNGWQSQINAKAVQDVIAAAIHKVTGDECKLTGSSRTDAGVHAFGYTANFKTVSPIPGEKFSYALNSVLPDDIVVKGSSDADSEFHSRCSALAKKYRYLIHNNEQPSALLRNRAWHVSKPLDIKAMKEAAGCFVGEYDFSAFKSAGSSIINNVRNITNTDLEVNNGLVKFEITGNGFLYKMVRIIAGTLVEVGVGKISPEDIIGIIESRNRNNAGKTAPPHGLYLVEVFYPGKYK